MSPSLSAYHPYQASGAVGPQASYLPSGYGPNYQPQQANVSRPTTNQQFNGDQRTNQQFLEDQRTEQQDIGEPYLQWKYLL